MRIAVVGCAHGELDRIYETIDKIQEEDGNKVDLLLCCGDFQATRNLSDLKCMACPDHHKDMCTFYKYYSGEKSAPVPTIFVGGNHEASNLLQELPFGGYVAPNIYYLGIAGVVSVSGNIRIAGLSGIFKPLNYLRGHFECLPYTGDSMRSVYHIRNLDVFRLTQMSTCPPDIMLTHDWPKSVYRHGDVEALLEAKFRNISMCEDIRSDQLGIRCLQELMEVIKPKYWFAAHLHVKFAAKVKHPRGAETKFLALDKCLPGKQFLQVLDIGDELKEGEKVSLEFDPAWLAVLKSTDYLQSFTAHTNRMPGPGGDERWNFKPTSSEIARIKELLGQDLTIPHSFEKTVKPFDPNTESLEDLAVTEQPIPRQNAQTVELCQKLGIRDPVDVILDGKWPEVPKEEEVHDRFDAARLAGWRWDESDGDYGDGEIGDKEPEEEKVKVGESGDGIVKPITC